MYIAVLDNGFVFVCGDLTRDGDGYTLTRARCIRTWGTSEGLGELVNGPTTSTVLDRQIPIMSVPSHAMLFTFPVSAVWAAQLS
jgi:hypothetical protein